MIDTLFAVLFVALAGAVGLAVLALVTVAPFVRAVDAVEARGGSPLRAGAAAIVGSAVALAVALVAARSTSPALGMVLLLLAWVVPVLAYRVPVGWIGHGPQHT